MPKLLDLFAQRRIFIDTLMKKEIIEVIIQQLIFILHFLNPLDAEDIKSCLEKDSKLWEKEANKLVSLNGSCIGSIDLEEITKLYCEKTSLLDSDKLTSIETFHKVSSQISEE